MWGKITDIFGYLLSIPLVTSPLQKFYFLLDKLCKSQETTSSPRSRGKTQESVKASQHILFPYSQ